MFVNVKKTHVVSIEGIVGGLIPEKPDEDMVKLFVISFIYVGGHSPKELMFFVKVFREDIVQKNPMKCEF